MDDEYATFGQTTSGVGPPSAINWRARAENAEADLAALRAELEQVKRDRLRDILAYEGAHAEDRELIAEYERTQAEGRETP